MLIKKNKHSLEPMTGMDMPFSSLVGGASVVRVPSNTGGLGGVMLRDIDTNTSVMVSTALMVLGEEARKNKQLGLTCGG